MSRRSKVLVGALLVALLFGGGFLLADRFGSGSTADARTDDSTTDPSFTTSEVRVETLVNAESFNADLGFGEVRKLVSPISGTITWLPEVGTIIEPGHVLWKVDQVPVLYLRGELPLYRDLYRNVSKGDDVRQLEEYLISVGLGPDEWIADTTFNTTTRNAVKALQKYYGLKETGRIDRGAVLFGTEALRVEARVSVGDDASSPILDVTTAVATVKLSASSRQLATFQNAPNVHVELSSGERFAATLTKVEATPADETGAFGYSVRYEVDAGVTEAQPVKILIETVLAADALTVPVDALLALAEGGYAVEVSTASGRVLRAVEVIDFEDTRVAVTGNVVAGDNVVVPS